jgi:hypothetical protein
MTLLTNAPIWVWPLFVLLVFVGLRATRPRNAPVALFYGLPFLGLLGLRSLLALPAPGWGLALWAIMLLIGAALGYAAQRRWLIERTGKTVSLRPEWLTLIVVMILFWSNFATGVVRATAPQMLTTPGYIATLAIILGLSSGSFLGRAIRVARS